VTGNRVEFPYSAEVVIAIGQYGHCCIVGHSENLRDILEYEWESGNTWDFLAIDRDYHGGLYPPQEQPGVYRVFGEVTLEKECGEFGTVLSRYPQFNPERYEAIYLESTIRIEQIQIGGYRIELVHTKEGIHARTEQESPLIRAALQDKLYSTSSEAIDAVKQRMKEEDKASPLSILDAMYPA
jgi:hypothetical protein